MNEIKKLMNSVYVFSFDMLTPMLSRRHVPNSFSVDSSMIKVGITQNLKGRIRDYRGTYKCHKCDTRHFNIEKTWDTALSKAELQSLESKLKAAFQTKKGEYYDHKDMNKIISWIDQELEG